MTDPLRRDPREFQRVLKLMAGRTSWQKTLLFASRGRMVGFPLGLEHYNSILFSQSLWGRALEIVKVVRAMEADGVKPNGASYYYICHGMANADHGEDFTGFQVNHKLPRLQHWRVAINALQAADRNGYDPTETMYSSCVAACSIPGIGKWRVALGILHRMNELEYKPHPQACKLLEKTLIKSARPAEATRLINMAAELGVQGYENRAEPDPFAGSPEWRARERRERDDDLLLPAGGVAGGSVDLKEQGEARLVNTAADGDEEDVEDDIGVMLPAARTSMSASVFRPRVYRQLWWKWHAIANRYKPGGVLKRRQLSPRDSPTGIPGFNRL